MPPLAHLWKRAVEGDAGAFAAFYECHADRVFDHCYYRTGSRSDAEDLTAEVFAITWRRRDKVRVDDDRDILPWLLTTANNLIMRLQRKSARRWNAKRRLSVENEPDIATAIAEQDELERDQARALAVLHALSATDREIIELCVVQGLSAAAVAQSRNVPDSTVRNQLARALRRARAAYHAPSNGTGVNQ